MRSDTLLKHTLTYVQSLQRTSTRFNIYYQATIVLEKRYYRPDGKKVTTHTHTHSFHPQQNDRTFCHPHDFYIDIAFDITDPKYSSKCTFFKTEIIYFKNNILKSELNLLFLSNALTSIYGKVKSVTLYFKMSLLHVTCTFHYNNNK